MRIRQVFFLKVLSIFIGTTFVLLGQLLASVDRPPEFNTVYTLVNDIFIQALHKAEENKDKIFQEKITKVKTAYDDTDIRIDEKNTGDDENCSEKKKRVYYTGKIQFLGITFGHVIHVCRRAVLYHSTEVMAQWFVHESVHAADLDQASEYRDEFEELGPILKFPKFECITEGLTYDIVGAAGRSPYSSRYTLQVLSTGGKTQYIRVCDEIVPGLSDRAFFGNMTNFFNSIENSKLDLTHVPREVVQFAIYEPTIIDERKLPEKKFPADDLKSMLIEGYKHSLYGNEFTAMHTAVYYGRLDWVRFLAEKTMTNVGLKDKQGRTPLQLAQETYQSEIVDYLLSPSTQWLNPLNKRLLR